MSIQVKDEVDEFFVERSRVSLKERLDLIVTTASNLAVTNEEHFRRITSLYAESKSWENKIEFIRKEANAPDQARISARNDKAKELLTPLKQIQAIAKDKSAQYQELLEQNKRKEEQKMAQAVELLGLDEMPYVPPVDKSIRGDGALMYTKMVKRFRLTDLSKVPLKYLMLNEEAIEQDIKLGVAVIPGIEIYEEKVTQLKAR
jgi:alanyl-tRNA synthetase